MKLLVVVDYQNDFVDGSLGFPGAELLDAPIARRVREAKAEGRTIIETKDSHGKDYLNTREGKALPVIHTVPGTPGWETYGETGRCLKEIPHTVIMKKAFGCPPDEMLKLPDDVDEVEFVGLVSNMCVLSNVCVFQARYPEAQMVVHRGLTASFNQELHDKTMDVLEGIQVKVID